MPKTLYVRIFITLSLSYVGVNPDIVNVIVNRYSVKGQKGWTEALKCPPYLQIRLVLILHLWKLMQSELVMKLLLIPLEQMVMMESWNAPVAHRSACLTHSASQFPTAHWLLLRNTPRTACSASNWLSHQIATLSRFVWFQRFTRSLPLHLKKQMFLFALPTETKAERLATEEFAYVNKPLGEKSLFIFTLIVHPQIAVT